jgi:hypothetical protein
MGIRSPSCDREQNVELLSARTLMGRNAFSNCLQAVNCQVTFIESLRDKVLCVAGGLLLEDRGLC